MKNFVASLATLLLVASSFALSWSTQDDKADEEKQPNLLVNGSFEEGPDPGPRGVTWFNEGATDIKGWTVTRGQISYVSTMWQHADGKRALDLHGSPGFGGIKQTFKTKKDQKYRVTFAMAGSPGGRVAKKELGVSAAGKEEKFVFDSTDKNAKDMGWATQVWDFVATDDETTVEFYTLMTEDENFGPALDKVSVAPVTD
jgi:choice-of-anchor C domain-containing protein